MFFRALLGEEGFLGIAAGVPEGDGLPWIEVDALGGEGGGGVVGEGEVHVVAADERVVADGDAAEGELAFLFGDADQGEVGRAASDVADEERVADLQLLAPLLALV